MPTFSTHPDSWFADLGWIESMGQRKAPSSVPLVATRIKGIPAWITPPWALESSAQQGSWAAISNEFEHTNAPLMVCDLPPGERGNWDNAWIVQPRHTRWLRADEETGTFLPLPKHRAKQLRKGTERGLHVASETDVQLLFELHQQARARKSIASNADMLKGLLSWGGVCT